MHEFLSALLGGVMIGLAAVILMAGRGQIMGISGIASRLLPPVDTGWLWRINFLAGVFAAPWLVMAFTNKMPSVTITGSIPLLVVGGLLVGFGTVFGNGCTSGHGVCGLSRFSKRSIIATGIFMLSAICTVLAVNVLGAGA